MIREIEFEPGAALLDLRLDNERRIGDQSL
jgi:hypothetical protein